MASRPNSLLSLLIIGTLSATLMGQSATEPSGPPASAPAADDPASQIPVRIGTGVTPPKALDTPNPEFPDWARKARKQGTVRLTAVIGTDGRAHNVEVVKSLDPRLDEKAMKIVSDQWRFEPGKKDGKPVPIKVSIEVNFKLY